MLPIHPDDLEKFNIEQMFIDLNKQLVDVVELVKHVNKSSEEALEKIRLLVDGVNKKIK